MRYHKTIAPRLQRFAEGDSTLYNRWKHMRERCMNPKRKDYKYYGGKGVTVCREWDRFHNFYVWFDKAMEYYAAFNGRSVCVRNLVIDRINPDKGYCPDNCRLITVAENSRRAIKRRDAKGRFAV